MDRPEDTSQMQAGWKRGVPRHGAGHWGTPSGMGVLSGGVRAPGAGPCLYTWGMNLPLKLEVKFNFSPAAT